MRRRLATGAALLLAAVTAGCGFGGASTAATTTTVAPVTVVYAAIGGAGTAEDDPDSQRRVAWPRLLFREHLPAQTIFTDLAERGTTVRNALRDQLPTALDLGATVVTVWFGDDELGEGPDDAEDALAAVIGPLVDTGATIAVTAGVAPAASWADAVARVAARTGAVPVDLSGARGQEAIAERFAAALDLPG